MIKAGIVGGSGYVAGELLRCLIHHPQVEIDFVYSHSHSGKTIVKVHQDLFDIGPMIFTNTTNPDVEVVFLCLGHGNSRKFLSEHPFSKETKIIDLSSDFRLKKDAFFNKKTFLYGLVENNKEKISQAQYIANPGCFATAIQLALLPLAAKKEIREEVHVHAITGSTGAGQSMTETTHFSWRNNNLSVYKAFEHQHLHEISENIKSLHSDFEAKINFIPIRGNFTRGILATAYTKINQPFDRIFKIFEHYYRTSPFISVTKEVIHLKQVVNTNNCLLHVAKHDDNVLITCVIDNLLKGAAGQAIQNMNLMFGLEEKSGLHLKSSFF